MLDPTAGFGPTLAFLLQIGEPQQPICDVEVFFFNFTSRRYVIAEYDLNKWIHGFVTSPPYGATRADIQCR